MNRELIEVIERLNLENIELRQSREYILGKKFLNFKSLIRQFKLKTIILKIFRNKKMKYLMLGQLKNNMDYNYLNNCKTFQSNELKICVYTCITGNYDNPPKIYLKESNVDYYLITNNRNIKSKDWKILYLDEIDDSFKNYNDAEINRFFKLNPYYLFDKYNYSIYIDGNVDVISTLSDLIKKIDSTIGISMHSHKDRNCIYDEAKVCEFLKKGNTKKIQELLVKYENEGFPQKYGMAECTIIVTDIKNNTAKTILNNWWEILKATEVGRDQIILPYILWRNNLDIKKLTTLGNNIYKNPKFRINNHK